MARSDTVALINGANSPNGVSFGQEQPKASAPKPNGATTQQKPRGRGLAVTVAILGMMGGLGALAAAILTSKGPDS